MTGSFLLGTRVRFVSYSYILWCGYGPIYSNLGVA